MVKDSRLIIVRYCGVYTNLTFININLINVIFHVFCFSFCNILIYNIFLFSFRFVLFFFLFEIQLVLILILFLFWLLLDNRIEDCKEPWKLIEETLPDLLYLLDKQNEIIYRQFYETPIVNTFDKM